MIAVCVGILPERTCPELIEFISEDLNIFTITYGLYKLE